MREQFVLLVRHFFGRFFDNELVSPHGEMNSSVGKILAVLASPGLVCFWLFTKYSYLSLQPADVMESASLPDKLFFLTYSMVVMGFVTILEWDALFPDRRDYSILIPLPIGLRSIFIAKIASLCALMLIFFVDINSFSILLFPPLYTRRGTSVFELLTSFGAHLKAVLSATAFIFLFFVALQGLLMNVLSFRSFKRLSTYVQLASVFVLLLMLLLFFEIAALLDSSQMRHLLYYFPPAWFLGLYEIDLGKADPLPGSAAIAMKALAAVFGGTVLAYAVSYKRHVRKSLESEEVFHIAPSWVSKVLAVVADRLILKHDLERASFYFIGKTIVRNRKHWLYLSAYVGVGLAFVLQSLLGALSRSASDTFSRPGIALLSVPLILSFFVLSGMRYIFTIPSDLKSNWVFQLSAQEDPSQLLSGARKAMFIFGILPLYALLCPAYLFLWGLATTLFHAFFGMALSLILIECLLLDFRKIPFTCSYLPGKANITTHWIFYWLMFTTYAYSMAALEFWMLRSGARMAAGYMLAMLAMGTVIVFRNRQHENSLSFIFEDEPEPTVRTLNLSIPGSW